MTPDDETNLREPRPLTQFRWADVDKGALVGALLLVAGGIGVAALLAYTAAWLVGA
jgi:hypothetical protein